MNELFHDLTVEREKEEHDDHEKRLALLMAATPALAADGWLDLGMAPHDGSEVEIRVVNFLAPYETSCPNRYIDVCRAHWIDHNGGGFTWYGLAGTPSHWRPIAPVSANKG